MYFAQIKHSTPTATLRYGFASQGNAYTSYQFTSQRNETALGLYFYNARWYDPALGRFTRADTLVPAGVQGYDRYAYTSNNPVRYTDPSGHSPCDGLSNYRCQIRMRKMKEAEWGISDDDLMSLLEMAKMGDVIAYNLFGAAAYAMFARDAETGALALWDMTMKTQISLFNIRDAFMGFYQYDKGSDNFRLNLGIGNNPRGSRNAIGDTLGFRDFPVGWPGGDDSHVRYYPQDEFRYNGPCTVAGILSGAGSFREITLLALRSGGSLPWLGVGIIALAVDIVAAYSNGNPVVIMYPGPAQPAAPVPVLDFPQ